MDSFSLLPSPSQTPPVVLKWVGSKGPLAPHVCSLLWPHLQAGQRYLEPFAGSLAVFFHLRAMGYQGPAILSDVLAPLINFYTQLREEPRGVWSICDDIEAKYQASTCLPLLRKPFYTEQRERMNEGEGGPMERAGRFVWINHRAFNGLWRTNKHGDMTTDWGGERTHLPSWERFQRAALALQNAKLFRHDFYDSLVHCGAGDVIYADPPYAQGYRYYAGSFNNKDQERLAETLHTAYKNGAVVVSSNADTPEIRALYSWAELRPLQLRYTIGGAVHKTGNEVLIVGVKR